MRKFLLLFKDNAPSEAYNRLPVQDESDSWPMVVQSNNP